jgi:glycosidase
VSDGSAFASPDATRFTPEWAFDALIYHVYPLGFLGAPRRNPGEGEPVPRLLELRRWYDHLAALGVNTVLLGPVFESQSHGYDTVDLRRVDRRLGRIDTLRTIVDELHDRGMRVLLDGVFNHTGRHFFAFDDLRMRGRRSPYVDWYRVDLSADNHFRDGFRYDGWHGSLSLPELNLRNDEVRDYLLHTARYWLEEVGVDGWRLDAAGDVAPDFWRAFRDTCKAVKPDCFLMAELVFGEYDKYLGPRGLDGATHYPLYDAIMRGFTTQRFGRVARLLREHRASPHSAALVSFLGNHDVTRLHSHLPSAADVRPAMLLFMTLPFTPCWYYGDECGMQGDKRSGDAVLRRAMPRPDAPWPDGGEVYRALARLASLRAAHPVLRRGTIQFVRAAGERLAFVIHDGRCVALIAVHLGARSTRWSLSLPSALAPPGVTFHDALDPEGGTEPVAGDGRVALDPLPAKWGRVLIAEGGV